MLFPINMGFICVPFSVTLSLRCYAKVFFYWGGHLAVKDTL
jgi:hypothetical protein